MDQPDEWKESTPGSCRTRCFRFPGAAVDTCKCFSRVLNLRGKEIKDRDTSHLVTKKRSGIVYITIVTS